MDRGLEVFEHTSDLGIIARGESLEETLARLLRGVFSIITDLSAVVPGRAWTISASGHDLEEATAGIVNEALFLHETERALCSSFEVAVRAPSPGDQGVVIEARCCGECIDPGRHTIQKYIKAATYHGIRVLSHEIRIILDV
ncbi:MAG: archease [Firmicutes bacterium]|nr:archease [Bacillota bacterium]